jgi:hypothetical protein
MTHSVAVGYAGAFSCAVASANDPRHECLGYGKIHTADQGLTLLCVAQAFMPGTANGPRSINGYRPGITGGAR